MVEVLRVTDETSRQFLGELINQANRDAKRQQRIVKQFERDKPTKWDEAHADIDALVTDWESAPR